MTGGFALLAGVLAGLAAAAMPAAGWRWVALAAALLVLLSPLRHRAWPRGLAVFVAGLWLALSAIHHWQSLRVVNTTPDTRLLLEGTVMSVPARDGAELYFDADVRMVDPASTDPRLRRARLAWRNAPVAPRVGERWRWLVRLAPVYGRRNLTGIDNERAALRDRVQLAGRVLPAALNSRLTLANSSIDTLRARVAARIAVHVADPDAAALLTALAVGLTSGMSADQWRVFNATGTTHLVAISGLHVTLFAMLALIAARTLWRCTPFPRFVDREPFALLLALAAAGAYSLLAGFSVPTQRTWLMLAVFALARLSARRVGAGRIWSLSLIAVLLLDAFAPLAAGFWLSFIAVGVILVIETTALIPGSRLQRAVRLQAAVMLALAPLTLAVFGGVSLVGLAVNVVAIPIVSFVFVPLVLAGALAALVAPLFCAALFSLAAVLYQWLWPALVWAADFELAQWRADPPGWWFILAIPAAWLLLLRWPWPLRATAAGLALGLLCAPSRMPAHSTVHVSVLDAGRGVAVLIATHSRVLLFDTGDGWNTHGARMAQVVIPALDALGRRRVDLLVLPGLSNDRAEGAAWLAVERDVGRILVGGGWPATSLPVSRCEDAQFVWDGVGFEILSAGDSGRHCMLRVTANGRALLLGGDLDRASELALLARLPASALSCDVVILGRQASAQGSSPEWIEKCAAGLVIAAGGIAGSDARADALERWRRAGAQVLDTQRDGAIEISFGTEGVTTLATAAAARYPFAWRRVD